LGQQDPQSGKWKGLAITMGNALAAQLGVSLVPIQSPGPAQTYQALQSGSVDVALAQLQLKPDGVSSTGAVVSVEHTFLVRADSALKSVADVDRQGIKIGGVGSEGHTAILGSRLQHAQLVRFNSDAQGLAALAAGQIDAYASGRFALVDMSSQIPGSRILDGSFFTPMFAFATLSSRPTGAAFLNTFAASELSTGEVKRDIDTIVARPGVIAGPPA
jgi:polar amino acid transport system substrate-binding protein